ncbi:MAG: tetratricopeptide repeat protein [Bryobacteraceae bacterium]
MSGSVHRTLALLLLLCACSRSLPPLPEVSTASFLPAIRQAVETALAGARAHPNDASRVGRLGMVLHAHDQLAAARACYRRASLLDPKSFDWLYYTGLVSDGADAAGALRSALRLRDDLPAKLRLGEVLLASGDSEGARAVYRGLDHPAALFGYGRAASDPAYYEKALAAFPQYGAAMFALAQHYQRTGRTAGAERLMAAYPAFMTSAPRVDDPRLAAVRALNQGPGRLLSEAANLEAEGQLTAAADLNLKALDLDPRLTQAHVNLIALYGRLGASAKAEEHYERAIALNPNAQEAHYNFGVLCYQAKRRSEAQAAFSKALAINPGYAEAHSNLATLLEEQGNLSGAAKHFEKAIELQPGFRLARFHLGRIYANQRQFAQAIAQFQRTVAVDDESTPTYLYALGATEARAGNRDGARSTLAAAREKAIARGQSSLAASIERDLARLKQ